MKKIYLTILLALVTSVGMMNAKVTWNSSNISNLQVYGTYGSYSKEGVTLSANADMVDAMWVGGSHPGISFNMHETGGFTFSNTLGKNFTKIEMSPSGYAGWDNANLGSGWSISGDFWNDEPITVTWTGNASTVDLLNGVSNFNGENVESIVFYFVGDSEEPDPTYTVALKAGTVNADKVTLSATSAIEGATVTVTPNEEYEITAFSAKYNTTQEAASTLDPATGAYSFTMPAYAVTIEATIALKPVPEGDIFAGFTATAGSDGFTNEGSANLVDNKFISSDWTKWCTNDGHKSVPTGESESCWWLDFEASAALNLTGYILTTGNDTGTEHGRNPKNWVLKAKLNAGDAWTTIATVTNDVTMKNKSFKDYKFFVDQSGTYKYFRFEVSANQGAGVMQLCELRLIGTEVYTVAGSSTAVFGASWDASNAANDMVYDSGDGLYHFTKNNVELAAGSISFKVVKNHSWDEAYPAQDYVFNIATAGIHNITITFNESTKEVIANDELVEEEVILPVVKVAGNFVDDGWGANAVVLTPALDNLTASGAVTIPNASSFELKVVVGDDWKTVGNVSNWLTRVNNEDVFSFTGGTGNNTHIDMDMVGEYTFTYTYATGALTIAYPQTYTRHFEHAYYSTICLPQAATLTNATAYTVASIANGYISLSAPDNGLVAGTPYIIKPDADDVDVIAIMSGNPTANTVAGANGLWGVLNIGGVDSVSNGNYILSENQFHRVQLTQGSGKVSVPRFRGALWSDVVLAPALRIVEAGNEATDIRDIEGNETAVKFIQNGQLFIKKNGVVYDAVGTVVK